MVIIRCDIVKGKGSSNLNRPGFEAAPRQQEGYVLDLGNIGKTYFLMMKMMMIY